MTTQKKKRHMWVTSKIVVENCVKCNKKKSVKDTQVKLLQVYAPIKITHFSQIAGLEEVQPS
jgi:Zn ribbon nucleic-acid-binding protein